VRRALTVAVVALVLLSGCSGVTDGGDTASPDGDASDTATPATTDAELPPTATPVTTTSIEPVETPTTDYSDPENVAITIENGQVPYDQNRTWVRVLDMLDVNTEPPTEVEYIRGRGGVAGSATGIGSVYLDSKDESVLAHEFTHVALLRLTPEHPTSSADETFARDAIVEGSAEYVQRVYAARYLDREGALDGGELPNDPARAYVIAPYVLGYDYVDGQVNDASEVLGLHRYPPDTSEAIIHGLEPGSEPPAPLFVTAADRHLSTDAEWRYDGTRALGEIVLLLTLRTRLGDERAAEGAAGWGNDGVLTMVDGDDGEQAFVWVQRWDDRENASRFMTVGDEYVASDPPYAPPGDGGNLGNLPQPEFLETVWGPTDETFEVQRVGPLTTALVVGPEGFAGDVSYERDGQRVRVSVGDGDGGGEGEESDD